MKDDHYKIGDTVKTCLRNGKIVLYEYAHIADVNDYYNDVYTTDEWLGYVNKNKEIEYVNKNGVKCVRKNFRFLRYVIEIGERKLCFWENEIFGVLWRDFGVQK